MLSRFRFGLADTDAILVHPSEPSDGVYIWSVELVHHVLNESALDDVTIRVHCENVWIANCSNSSIKCWTVTQVGIVHQDDVSIGRLDELS